jgi:hypothetical protein
MRACTPISTARAVRRHILLLVLTWCISLRWKARPPSNSRAVTPCIPCLSSMARKFSLSPHSTWREESKDRSIVEPVFIPDNLFDGSTPRLSCLELSNCGISWNLPLLKGHKYLEILTPFARPKLTVWLGAHYRVYVV